VRNAVRVDGALVGWAPGTGRTAVGLAVVSVTPPRYADLAAGAPTSEVIASAPALRPRGMIEETARRAVTSTCCATTSTARPASSGRDP
jgi:hypothetical protein